MDPATKTKFRNLIKSGLYEDNLRELQQLAKDHFFESPALYGLLISLSSSLIDEFSEGHIDTVLLKYIQQNLTRPMLDAFAAQSAQPKVHLDALNELHRAWYKL